MKREKKVRYESGNTSKPLELEDAARAYEVADGPMVRTQIYLSRREHDFIQSEAVRRGQPMAEVIRGFIDEKMEVPEQAWMNNPMLEAPVADPSWKGREDGAINHDHYIYGTPKKWLKRNGKWVEAPPLAEDYYTNPKGSRQNDEKADGEK